MKHQLNRFERRAGLQVTPLALAIAGLFSANVSLAQDAQDKKPDAKEEPPATVIVTGVMAQTKAKDANISYSVLTKEDINRFTPQSAQDLLRDMPGVNVESNDGVARGEVYTRGMSVGSVAPTAGYFWTSIMEDGLPVLPVQFSAMQSGNFYRADISTGRVESVRGGTSGTTFGSSVGGAFNFISSPVRPGASVQTRLGFEGGAYHPTWKEVNTYYGKVNEKGDAGFNFTTFYRRSTGAVDPGYDLNHGGQIKANVFKNYETAGGGSGTLKLTLKHLDDNNAAMTNNAIPTYGFSNPQIIPGFGRNPNFFINGGQHQVPTDAYGNSIYHDPEEGYSYKQDAIWLKWDHDTGGPWSFSGAAKGQLSTSVGMQSQTNGNLSLWNLATFQNNFNVNQNGTSATAAQNLNRLAGYYELYDMNTGELRARVANNVGTSRGVNYRTGAPCAAGTAASPAQCVVFTNLPSADYDLRGGLVNGVMVPANTSNQQVDQVVGLRAEMVKRQSRDYMFNLQANYHTDTLNMSYGLYADQVHQQYLSYGSGFALSPFADGQITPLGVRFAASNGTTYQLTDAGGWGRLGSGSFSTFNYRMKERDVSPYMSAAWKITDHWDVTGSYKATISHFKTTVQNYAQNTSSTSATSRTYGGLDGNALTWYDNFYWMPSTVIEADRSFRIRSFSYSLGYTVNPQHKIYYRFSRAQNNLMGAVSRWTTPASLTAPILPQGEKWDQEIAWNFDGRNFNGQLTYWWTQAGFPTQPSGTNVDGSLYYANEFVNTYVTRGVEAWAKVRVTPNLTWNTSVTFATGRTTSETTFVPGLPGPGDDTYRTVSGSNIPRLAKWTTSNTLAYKYKDFWFNVRHRYMTDRRVNADPANPLTLPKQNNTDLGIQYMGYKNTRISFEVRNLFNKMYISALDTNIATLPTGVSKVDVYNQLPDSASFIKVNPSRSFWLTMQHDF